MVAGYGRTLPDFRLNIRGEMSAIPLLFFFFMRTDKNGSTDIHSFTRSDGQRMRRSGTRRFKCAEVTESSRRTGKVG